MICRCQQGIQLPNETEKGNFAFIDGTTIVTEEDPLSVLHGALARSMIPGSLVVVDDTTALLYAGSKEVELLRFLRTLRATARLVCLLILYCRSHLSDLMPVPDRRIGTTGLSRRRFLKRKKYNHTISRRCFPIAPAHPAV